MPGANFGDWPELPFCSERCKLIDLGRWLGERYSVRAHREDDEELPADDEIRIP
jgi:endogenous inhibitor of DNA gyrase (YacG/DUF329 family)